MNMAILAQATTQPANVFPWVHLPLHWPGQIDLLAWCQNMGPGLAALLILVDLLNGAGSLGKRRAQS